MLAGLLVMALAVGAAPASAKTVFGSNGCGTSEYEPDLIAFACADGKLRFENPEWTRWDGEGATATGLLRHPDTSHPSCADKPIVACPWVEASATLELWRPVYCASNGRWQFTRLRVEAPEDVDPAVRTITRDFKCGDYGSPRPQRFFLRANYAESLMREALTRRPALSFQAGYARSVSCGKRVARDRIRCTMSWIVGDLSFRGRGRIWITYPGGTPFWNFAYRITRLNEYCVVVGGRDCTRVFVAR